MKHVFGLIGEKLGHSFSKKYFNEKFQKEGLEDCTYELFELPSIDLFPNLLVENPFLSGLNVTIPYKSDILKYLTDLDPAAKAVGAVNTIKLSDKGIHGFNTDVFGFERSLFEHTSKEELSRAVILGTGGASKAVRYVLSQNSIPFHLVSRTGSSETLTYEDLKKDRDILKSANLIVNTTPLGMYPEVDKKPDIPYDLISKNHILFDLVYNPELTVFLKEGASRGATIINGLKMLHYQADRAWQIWNDPKI